MTTAENQPPKSPFGVAAQRAMSRAMKSGGMSTSGKPQTLAVAPSQAVSAPLVPVAPTPAAAPVVVAEASGALGMDVFDGLDAPTSAPADAFTALDEFTAGILKEQNIDPELYARAVESGTMSADQLNEEPDFNSPLVASAPEATSVDTPVSTPAAVVSQQAHHNEEGLVVHRPPGPSPFALAAGKAAKPSARAAASPPVTAAPAPAVPLVAAEPFEPSSIVDDPEADLTAILASQSKAPGANSRFLPAQPPADYKPRNYASLAGNPNYERHAENALATAQGRAVAIDIAAAKVLTPLVAAISVQNGYGHAASVKAAVLRDMILSVKKATSDVILPISPYAAASKPLRSQLMQAISAVMAKRWVESGEADLGEFVSVFQDMIALADDDFAVILNDLAQDSYVKASDEDSAKGRLFITLSECIWRMVDHIQSDRLRVQVDDRNQKWYFMYDQEPSTLATSITESVLQEVRALQPNISDADVRITYLQSSLRRLTDLVGAEYVSVTRKLMNWMAAEGVSDQDFQARKQDISSRFHSEVLPQILESARKNYIAIEQSARRMVDEQPLTAPAQSKSESESSK